MTQTDRRVAFWNEFIAECCVKDAQKYQRMQRELVDYMHRRNQQFSENGAAELIVAVAERLGEVKSV